MQEECSAQQQLGLKLSGAANLVHTPPGTHLSSGPCPFPVPLAHLTLLIPQPLLQLYGMALSPQEVPQSLSLQATERCANLKHCPLIPAWPTFLQPAVRS